MDYLGQLIDLRRLDNDPELFGIALALRHMRVLIQHGGSDMQELFDPKLSIDTIEANPEKKRLLAPVDLPSRAWLYIYVNNWERRPDEGKALVVERYGKRCGNTNR